MDHARSWRDRKSWRRRQRELLARDVADNHSYGEYKASATSSNSRTQQQQRELALLQSVVDGRGFVAQQLRDAPLTPLARWFHQLQLLALGDAPPHTKDEETELEGDPLAAALLALEHDDVTCFDVRFASDARCAQDEAALLLDDRAATHRDGCLEELLSFSTMKRGRVCRVTCVHSSNESSNEQSYAFRSSLYVRDLEANASRLLLQSPHASDVGRLVELLWRELAP